MMTLAVRFGMACLSMLIRGLMGTSPEAMVQHEAMREWRLLRENYYRNRTWEQTLADAHAAAVRECRDGAEALGLTMSCGDEGACPDGGYSCPYFADALENEVLMKRDALLDECEPA